MELPLTFLISSGDISNKLFPLNFISPPTIRPVFSGRSLKMLNAVVVFPAPVSPTSPQVSPFLILRFIPFTAFTVSKSVLYITSKSSISRIELLLLFFTSIFFSSQMYYDLRCGSKESRKPSPNRLIEHAVITIAKAGNIIKCGAFRMNSRDSDNICPHSGCGEGIPRPKKLKVDS